jgi:uncharacterized membrane protein YcfT
MSHGEALSSGNVARNRYGWVDIARGICIVAVVCYYAKTYMGYSSLEVGWLEEWTRFARPFRMPDFFLLSGLFLARVISRPWRSYLDTKVIHYAYFIVVWTVLYLAWRIAYEEPQDLTFGKVAKLYFWFLVQPMAMLWFIQTLSLYFVVTRLLRSVPAWIMLPAAAVLMALRIHTGFAPLDNFFTYYVFFLAGYFLASRIFSWADWVVTHRMQAWGLFLLWMFANTYVVWQGWSLLPVLDMVVGFVGIAAVIALSALVADHPWMQWIRYLGSHSIVVYLGFYLPLQWWLVAYKHFNWHMSPDLLATLTVVVGVLAAILLNRLVRGNIMAFLFKRPHWAHLVPPRSSFASETAN